MKEERRELTEEEKLEVERNKINSALYNVFNSYVYSKTGNGDFSDITGLINKIDFVLGYDVETKNKLLGGKFDLFPYGVISEGQMSIPLYLSFDILKYVLETMYSENVNASRIIAEINAIMLKLSYLLPYDSFDLESNPEILNKISEYKAAFDKREKVKDSDEFKKLDAVVRRYFKDGEIPFLQNFRKCLLDQDLDYETIVCLKRLCVIYSKNTEYDFIMESKDIITEIEKLESAKKEHELHELESAIADARRRYNSLNPLRRFVKKKMYPNPENLKFNEMSIDEINSLYHVGIDPLIDPLNYVEGGRK